MSAALFIARSAETEEPVCVRAAKVDFWFIRLEKLDELPKLISQVIETLVDKEEYEKCAELQKLFPAPEIC